MQTFEILFLHFESFSIKRFLVVISFLAQIEEFELKALRMDIPIV